MNLKEDFYMKIEKYLISDYNSSDIADFKTYIDKKCKSITPKTAIAHYFVKSYLSKYYNTSINNIVFKYNNQGKPYYEGALRFSITHSGNYIFCAYNMGDIGIDVEIIKPISQSIIKRIATEDERLNIENYSDIECLKFWTIKEAYIKLIGSTIFKAKTFSIKDIIKNYEVNSEVTNDYVLSIVKQK